MPNKVSYEHGARKLMAQDRPDPSDEFSQKAAENRKPALGVGLDLIPENWTVQNWSFPL